MWFAWDLVQRMKCPPSSMSSLHSPGPRPLWHTRFGAVAPSARSMLHHELTHVAIQERFVLRMGEGLAAAQGWNEAEFKDWKLNALPGSALVLHRKQVYRSYGISLRLQNPVALFQNSFMQQLHTHQSVILTTRWKSSFGVCNFLKFCLARVCI